MVCPTSSFSCFPVETLWNNTKPFSPPEMTDLPFGVNAKAKRAAGMAAHADHPLCVLNIPDRNVTAVTGRCDQAVIRGKGNGRYASEVASQSLNNFVRFYIPDLDTLFFTPSDDHFAIM